MIKLTVKEYANKYNTTVSNVYQKIKRKSLESFKDGNITYIVDDVIETVKPLKANCKAFKKEIKLLREIIKSKDSEIETLKISLNDYSSILKLNVKQLENNVIDDVIEVETNNTKKKKKKSKKSKKKHS